jgi:hypothetical protein
MCKELSSAAALKQHIKNYHQPQAHVQYPAGTTAAATTTITRLDDGFFYCLCARKFRDPYRLQVHTKTCNGTDRCPPVAAAEATGSDAPILRTTAMRSVRVTSRDCTDADGLAELGLLVNTQTKIIICRACEYAVGADHLAAHMRTHHKLVRLPEGFGDRLVEKYGVKKLPERPIVSDGGEPVEAIGGLPIYPGFRCTMCCTYYCRKRASMLEHIRLSHKDQDGRHREDTEGAGAPSMTACRVQTIFTGLFKRYFGVLDDDDGEDQEMGAEASSLWAIVERELDEQEERCAAAVARAAGRLPDDQRLCDPFISRVRWDLVLREGRSEDDYVHFVALPRGDEEKGLGRLPQLALDYINLVSGEIYKRPVSLRRKMMALSEYVSLLLLLFQMTIGPMCDDTAADSNPAGSV